MHLIQKKYLILVLFCCFFQGVSAQTVEKLTLEEAYKLIEENHPLSMNKELIRKISEVNSQLLKKEKLPTLNLSGTGQIQSENLEFGNVNTPFNIKLPLESFKAFLEANYNLYDGGILKTQKELEVLDENLKQNQLKVSLRELKNSVNDLFFLIKLSKQQQAILNYSIEDLKYTLESVEAGYENGIFLESDVLKLKVKKLELESQATDLKKNVKSFLLVLNDLLGIIILETSELVLPNYENIDLAIELHRPEQAFYDSKKEYLAKQNDILKAKNIPKLFLFGQGGVGYPNPVNFADVSTSFYAIGGFRLEWNFLDWGISKKEQNRLQLEMEQVEVEKEVFEFNINSQKAKYVENIASLKNQIQNDLEIVELQTEISKQTKAQLQEGVITSDDYLIQLNAELNAKQTMELHKVQLAQSITNYLTIFGKL
ncbi:TolC family protein [Aureivirga marina]|uniref:TolC family protein n=1 Tax=Aureivirga marina TaxID=1182451 RepID=UPI0018CAA89C|nr:TolC family protein [Aureivirga marina]